MSDLLERLAAANPVPESERPSIDELWRKLSELEAGPRSGRTARWGWLPGGGRATLALAAVVVPGVVVVALAVPLLGARPGRTGPTSAGRGHTQPALDPTGQRIAARALAGRAGSIVALDPRTGAIRAMYANGGSAAQLQYPPGATFDIVTAAAALDSGRYVPSSRIAGSLTLSGALRYSVDSAFAPRRPIRRAADDDHLHAAFRLLLLAVAELGS